MKKGDEVEKTGDQEMGRGVHGGKKRSEWEGAV